MDVAKMMSLMSLSHHNHYRLW